MARAYPNELRTRALELIDKVKSISKVKELLNISRQTLYKWQDKQKQEGGVEAKVGYQKGHSKKITNMKEFKELIDNNADKSLKELARISNKWSATTIWRGIKALGYSYKKNFHAYQKGRWSKE